MRISKNVQCGQIFCSSQRTPLPVGLPPPAPCLLQRKTKCHINEITVIHLNSIIAETTTGKTDTLHRVGDYAVSGMHLNELFYGWHFVVFSLLHLIPFLFVLLVAHFVTPGHRIYGVALKHWHDCITHTISNGTKRRKSERVNFILIGIVCACQHVAIRPNVFYFQHAQSQFFHSSTQKADNNTFI